MDEYELRMAQRWAAAYEAGRDGWSTSVAARRTSTTVLAELPRGSRVLEVGAGRGVDVARYAQAGHEVLGIDVVALPDWAEVQHRWPHARFAQTALRELPVTDPFDVVVDAGCFHHQHPAALGDHLAAVRRQLRAGGTFWLATLQPRGPDTTHSPSEAVPSADGTYTLAFSTEQIRVLLERAGFEILSTALVPRNRGDGLDDLLVRAVAACGT